MWRYLKPIVTFLPYAFGCYFRWIRKYALNSGNIPPQESNTRVNKLITKLNKAMDVDVHIIGQENIPEGVCYFVSNHIGAYDPLIVIKAIDKPVGVVAKIETSKYPFVGKLIKSIGGVFIDRHDIKQSLKEMIIVRDELEKGKKSWLVFPEGTRNKDDKKLLKQFHAGSFKPATKSGVPIVPVVVYGTQRITRSKPHFKKYPIYIEFCKPIYADAYNNMNPQELADYTRDTIQQKLSFSARKYDHEQMGLLYTKKYKFYKIV